MAKRRLILGLAFFMTGAFSAQALAAPSKAQKQSDIRTALSGLSLDFSTERVVTSKRGRQDLVLFSNADKRDVVAKMKRAYDRRLTLADGYKVLGWAHIAATDSYTFTVSKERAETFVAEVQADGRGSTVKLWGAAYKYRPHRRPLSTIPRRYVPMAGKAVMAR